jgi:hypothetical protein
MYINVTFNFVLYGLEACSATFNEELRLRAFKNKILTRKCGSKGGEVTGEWGK